jgi:hypothetical protein
LFLGYGEAEHDGRREWGCKLAQLMAARKHTHKHRERETERDGQIDRDQERQRDKQRQGEETGRVQGLHSDLFPPTSSHLPPILAPNY